MRSSSGRFANLNLPGRMTLKPKVESAAFSKKLSKVVCGDRKEIKVKCSDKGIALRFVFFDVTFTAYLNDYQSLCLF